MSRVAIVVSLLATVIAIIASGFTIHLLASDTTGKSSSTVLAVSQPKGSSTASTGGSAAITEGVAMHEMVTPIDREFSFEEWGTTFHGRSRFTRTGDMRYLQIVIDSQAVNISTVPYWLHFSWSLLGLTQSDMPQVTAHTTRQWCHALINGTWFHCVTRIHVSAGEIYIRTLEAGIDGPDWIVWSVASFDEIANAVVGIPSVFLAWPVRTPSPHGLHVERTPDDPVV